MSLRRLLAPGLLGFHRALSALGSSPAGAVRILVVHDVPEAWDAAFVQLLHHCRDRFGLIGPDEAARRLSGEAPADSRAPVLLTFDDGFASNFRVTAEILDPLGIKALFFVCPGLMDLPIEARPQAVSRHVFRGHVPPPAAPALMEWEQLRALVAAGHSIGGHSATHDCLAGLDADELERQVGDSRHRIETELGISPVWFAFPFGDVASIDATSLAAIGRHYRFCRSGIRGLAHAGCPPLALPAESIDLSSDAAWRLLAAEGGLAPLYRRQRAQLRQWARA